ncbi:unnamed protein product [Lactuca saligna]|uniref:Uncharacterized protein n=1 Tax=Lactuca saligna TaxID=75948 RepID=A0AA36E028_LACSI|nr:unnamed protein product [Lactuca saligna]
MKSAARVLHRAAVRGLKRFFSKNKQHLRKQRCILDIIPNQYKNSGIEDFVNYIRSYPFAMHLEIFLSHYTLSMYVSSIILALLTPMLKPLPKQLETNILGLLSMQHLLDLPYVFPNQKMTLRLLLRKNVSLSDPY